MEIKYKQTILCGNLNELGLSIHYMEKIIITAMENGPCIVTVDGKKIAALCRCGASENKPHCDGTHAKIGFKAKAAKIE